MLIFKAHVECRTIYVIVLAMHRNRCFLLVSSHRQTDAHHQMYFIDDFKKMCLISTVQWHICKENYSLSLGFLHGHVVRILSSKDLSGNFMSSAQITRGQMSYYMELDP